MKEKSINDWHDADSIDWEIYWEQIDTLDEIIKRDRNPKRKSSGGWRWPESNYNAPDIFRARFHLDGQVKKSYGEIAQTINLLTTNADKFVSGIVQSMLRRMNHPSRRRMWDLNMKNCTGYFRGNEHHEEITICNTICVRCSLIANSCKCK